MKLQLLLAIRAFFVEFAEACDLGAVSDSALRLGLDFKNAAEGQVDTNRNDPLNIIQIFTITCLQGDRPG